MDQSNTKAIAVATPQTKELSAFASSSSFETAQRMAKALASSDLVPQTYKGNLANCIVALEVSQRTGSSALAVMQNLNIIHGRPSWSSQYVIAALNSCGRFSPLRFKMEGEGKTRTCVAWTTDRDGEILEGPMISMAMADAEGWTTKSGSKWKTMPELMLRYRAASFFGKLYAPEILMGMKSEDEVIDGARDVSPDPAPVQAVASVNEKIKAKKATKKTEPVTIEHEPIAVTVADPEPAAPAPETAPPDTQSGEEFF